MAQATANEQNLTKKVWTLATTPVSYTHLTLPTI